ncbi:hypothetical protein GCM10010915_20510 [Microbacterium faecale]|uniref:Sodium:proton antiporter n=1 Tax=Microbacterium faecale TaxID=1804630 RepID=A0A916YCP7_9MICO|nr:hypothetical protein GCM10010915_20510 [Microbacterium faecale]
MRGAREDHDSGTASASGSIAACETDGDESQYRQRVTDDEVADQPRRNETADERADRNWTEVLQELRVLQTGTQILTGFLLALAFQPAFADLALGRKGLYLVLIALSALSSVLALAPVAAHRVLFRAGAKRSVVTAGHVCLIAALAIVSVLLAGVVGFVFDVVIGGASGWIAGSVLAAIAVVTWVLVPVTVRTVRRKRAD